MIQRNATIVDPATRTAYLQRRWKRLSQAGTRSEVASDAILILLGKRHGVGSETLVTVSSPNDAVISAFVDSPKLEQAGLGLLNQCCYQQRLLSLATIELDCPKRSNSLSFHNDG
jgi:hypothetical protein